MILRHPTDVSRRSSPLSPSARPYEELELVLELVRQCMPVALAYQSAGSDALGLRHKPRNGGPITEADRELNRRLVRTLATHFPDDAILAEESAAPGRWSTASRCWHVDPIDGTRDFARGRAGWTIQVGLCTGGTPTLGVVAEPAHDRITWGLLDPNAPPVAMQCVGEEPPEPLPPLATGRALRDLVLIGAKAYPLSRQQAIRRALEVDASRAPTVGSVGVRMIAVARGDADAYVQAPGRTNTWDTCAPEAILRAVGARVTDLRGHPLDYRGPTPAHPNGVITSSPTLHPAILERLEPLVDRWLRPRG
jgi:3'-phosphoadenosine 5'-phosphosulfate (PAPS) 3'-phosphatase